jgi:hypothetical protein
MAATVISLRLSTGAALDALIKFEEVFGFESPVDDGLVEL